MTGRPAKEVGTHSFRRAGVWDSMRRGEDIQYILDQGFWTTRNGSFVVYTPTKESYDAIDAKKSSAILRKRNKESGRQDKTDCNGNECD